VHKPQLGEAKDKSRVPVKSSLIGDVTSEEFHAALVTKYAKQKKAEEQANRLKKSSGKHLSSPRLLRG